MGYFLTPDPENAVPGNSLASPKTHGPFSPVEERGRRFYSAGIGRWLSRDPIEEEGGCNLYVFLGNEDISRLDLLGMDWNRQRTKMSWAIASPSLDSDTFASLASDIRLEYSERVVWLKHEDGTPVTASERAQKGCKYLVPNTMAVYTSEKEWFDFPGALVNYFRGLAETAGDNYEAKGYKVVRALSASSETGFINLWKEDGIVAYAFGGHGGEYQGVWYGFVAKAGSQSAVGPDQVHPPYKLQAIGAYSCGSANDIQGTSSPPQGPIPTMKWKALISSGGTFVGYFGSVNWYTVWFNQEAINPGYIPD